MASSSLQLLVLALSVFSLAAKAQESDDTGVAAVPAVLSFGEVKVVLKGADGSAISTSSGTYPKSLLANPQLPATLEVTFSVLKNGESFKPQQAMLMLKSKSQGLAAYAVGKQKGGSYVAVIGATSVEKQIGKLGGEYDVTLLAGDPSAAEGVAYPLGAAELLAAPGAGPEPARAVRTATFQPLNNLKPEIVHMFRAPDKRAPGSVAKLFSLLALAPLPLVVLYVWTQTGVNLKGLTTAPLQSLLFHGGLAGMLVLYWIFWTQLNLAQTLPLAAAGGLFVAATGYMLLSALSAQRLKKQD